MKQIQTERQWVGESELKWHSETKNSLEGIAPEMLWDPWGWANSAQS